MELIHGQITATNSAPKFLPLFYVSRSQQYVTISQDKIFELPVSKRYVLKLMHCLVISNHALLCKMCQNIIAISSEDNQFLTSDTDDVMKIS